MNPGEANAMDYQLEWDVAVQAVRDAMRLCRAVQAELSSMSLEKTDHSPVTVADYGSQALVCRAIREVFPESRIVAEETASLLRKPEHQGWRGEVVRRVQVAFPDVSEDDVLDWIDFGNAPGISRRFWTLDPIDGTKGFLRGEQYAVALALIVDGRVQVGVLGCPNLEADGQKGVIYAARRGGGSWQLPFEGEEAASTVRVSAVEEPSAARFCESAVSAHSSRKEAETAMIHLGITAPPVRMDSQAKYAIVARGDTEIYLRLPRRPEGYLENIWDHAAGMLVVEEAGGRVTDMHGAALRFMKGTRLEANQGIVATNGLLHDAVLEALVAVGVA